MSINLYLNGNEVVDLEGFETKHRSERGQEWEEYFLPGISLFRDKGRFYTILHHLEEPIPEVVRDLVEEISLYKWVPLRTKRVCGVYKHESAAGTLDQRTDHYELQIRGNKLEDIRELYHRIRAGKILPNESWEEEQAAEQTEEEPQTV